MAYDKYVAPFVDPITLSKDQIQEWVKLSKCAMDTRTWANTKCTKEMIFECERKIRMTRNEWRDTDEGRMKFHD